MAFTTTEQVDIRRFCGFGMFGGGQPLPASGYRFSQVYGTLEYKMNTMSAEEEAVVRTTYLANLATLEGAVVGSSANLDTDQAAVWKHNRYEVADRTALLNQWRRELCAFMGIPPGPGLGAGGNSMALVV